MKNFIRIGKSRLISVEEISTCTRNAEDIMFLLGNGERIIVGFDGKEEAATEFERISQLLLNPPQSVNATVTDDSAAYIQKLRDTAVIENMTDEQFITRLAKTFRMLGLNWDADRLEKVKLAPVTVHGEEA